MHVLDHSFRPVDASCALLLLLSMNMQANGACVRAKEGGWTAEAERGLGLL